ncbi:phage baseplate assembly protein V [Bauldia litoralis]|nr:phage baseplate assembly protein V [Bauldia litoralis]
MLGLVREIVEIIARVAELERRIAGMVRHGTVEEVDPARHRVRLNFGNDVDGDPFLSPWIPYAQVAGALKIHAPPSKGQQFSLLAPAGDWQQGVALPFTWSNQNPSPSESGNENVLTFGDARISVKDDRLAIDVGGVALNITGDGVTISGGEVTHDGKNIGATHIHGGIVVGSSKTDVPAN